ncbi:hypothetical protein KG088_08530 [Halomonas sp. TRM85114]|uniref:hypothetical protein n=1 Tax=Halomonas jincaotanensis TaxID=2810616 RepID=UPI001BD694DD|nr:hypothetical protein [Halomonas jincaotanensis]MBS9403675.1 hypothetical protein [Halomonas jincaotanensis]
MPLEIIDDQFMVCPDCLMIIANDDASGLDDSLSEKEAVEREQEIREAIAETQREGQIAVGDSERDDEFSVSPCACCGTRLAGQRHHCVILGSGRKS